MRGLTANERKLLDAIQADSRQSVSDVAKKVRMRHHSVSYTIKQLRERGVIRPYLLTNPHALGLTDYCIFFSCIGNEKGTRRTIIDYCMKSEQVAYFAELSGPSQYSVSLFCRSVFEVTEFFAALGKRLPKSSFESSFALRLQFSQFLGRWSNPATSPQILDRTRVRREVTIDEVERKILGFYSQYAEAPLAKVASVAGVSESTVRNRLARLERDGVIHSFAYVVDGTKIGILTYRIIIAATGQLEPLRKQLYRYMVAHPQASAFVHCTGAWDFELNFDVASSLEFGPIIEDVCDNFGPSIRRMHTAHELIVHRAHHFPHKAGLL